MWNAFLKWTDFFSLQNFAQKKLSCPSLVHLTVNKNCLKSNESPLFRRLKTCSCHCPLVRYFRTLFWDDITKICNENIVYFVKWEKNPVLDQQEVCLLNFQQQIIVKSSKNKVQKIRYKRIWTSFSSSVFFRHLFGIYCYKLELHKWYYSNNIVPIMVWLHLQFHSKWFCAKKKAGGSSVTKKVLFIAHSI